ncbi:hypothetical protein AMK68_02890 [candidate division KD3-62 bacterium DG_56]|uniref:Probable cytosol aminopeptidase n=1 Tax=candidate division KD3-62 bacterium DG_56 TaxID=1704032 RepID=A0A0S7XNP2_9BACT|nr:MAG: hypothetical protein AMK68_02890 [candidate division KD3-62 bacterium DG_56]
MRIRAVAQSVTEVKADALIVNLFEGVKEPGGGTAAVDKALGGLIRRLIRAGEIKGRWSAVPLYNEFTIIHTDGKIAADRVAVAGLGKREELNLERIQQVMGTAAGYLRRRGCKRVASIVHGAGAGGLEPRLATRAMVEGTLIGLYQPDAYKAKKDSGRGLSELLIVERDANKLSDLRVGIREGRITGEATNLARRLANEPANRMTPTDFARRAREIARRNDLQIQVLTAAAMRRLGMNALLGVAQGSDQAPRFVVIRHRGARGGPHLGLVGKGVTFDSGGISIKPSEKMAEMKADMSGAAAVLAAMEALARSKARINVTGFTPLVENMPSGKAQRPGDIVRALNGKTIEIDNTDAEGRLILADALAYAAKQKCTHLVDVATLTGACVIALGNITTGLMGNDDQWVAEVLAASELAAEKTWQLPLFREYRAQLYSDMADIKNVGGRPAGPITGGMFLKEFVGDTPWVHLDIAGTAWNSKLETPRAREATGAGVRTMVNLAWEMAR